MKWRCCDSNVVRLRMDRLRGSWGRQGSAVFNDIRGSIFILSDIGIFHKIDCKSQRYFRVEQQVSMWMGLTLREYLSIVHSSCSSGTRLQGSGGFEREPIEVEPWASTGMAALVSDVRSIQQLQRRNVGAAAPDVPVNTLSVDFFTFFPHLKTGLARNLCSVRHGRPLVGKSHFNAESRTR